MSKSSILPREHAARVLCRLDGKYPDQMIGGAYAWRYYTPQVDAVIRTILGEDSLNAMIEAEKNRGMH